MRPVAKLDFSYLDREILAAPALDATGKAVYQANPIKLDLLLVNAEDQTPILGEVKIRADKDPEAALLQGLVYASLMAPKAQRDRLGELYPDIFTNRSMAQTRTALPCGSPFSGSLRPAVLSRIAQGRSSFGQRRISRSSRRATRPTVS